jgi:Ca2+-binding RTX toxin-like protein
MKVAAIDPILDPEHPHDHVFYGNTGVDADSTYGSLVINKDTTCHRTYATSSYWNPVVKDGTTEVNHPSSISVYYVGRGDQTKVQPIPDGLQLIGRDENGKVDYRCGQDPPESSPPYGCTAENFRIRVHFPECWDRSSLNPDSLVRMSGGACPSSHPYQIPTIRMSVHYENVGGVLEGPLQVSAGGGEFLGADFFHADVFAAPQEPAFRDTIKKCVNNVADDAVPPTVCRPDLRPDTTLDPSGPSGTVASGSGTFTFSSPESDAAFECRVYQAGTTPGSFGTCSGNGTHDVSGLANGTYTFGVRAVEPFSVPSSYQWDLTPASRTWTVDITAPLVGGVSPADAATGVSLTANAEVTFSEEMVPSTLTTGTFTLTEQVSTTPVAAHVIYVDNKATLNPDSDLQANTTYTATIKGGSSGVKDLAGNAPAQDYTWTFTTASPPTPSCTITGTANAETISGTSSDDVICAGGGNDIVKGLGGNDTLKGEADNDTLLGGVGNDTLDGGLGTDTASYSASLTAVIASLATNYATGEGSDTFLGIENLLGSSKADTLTGSGTNNKLTGGGGNDTEHGGPGNDTVIGSGGADTLKGEDGADTVNSKDGVSGNDSLDGGAGTDTKVTDTTEKSIDGFP